MHKQRIPEPAEPRCAKETLIGNMHLKVNEKVQVLSEVLMNILCNLAPQKSLKSNYKEILKFFLFSGKVRN